SDWSFRYWFRLCLRLDSVSWADSVGDSCHRQRAGHAGEGNPAAGRLFSGTGGAVSVDVAADGALPEVLQPLPLAHARARSGLGRVADRAGDSAGDRALYADFKLVVVSEPLCVVACRLRRLGGLNHVCERFRNVSTIASSATCSAAG